MRVRYRVSINCVRACMRCRRCIGHMEKAKSKEKKQCFISFIESNAPAAGGWIPKCVCERATSEHNLNTHGRKSCTETRVELLAQFSILFMENIQSIFTKLHASSQRMHSVHRNRLSIFAGINFSKRYSPIWSLFKRTNTSLSSTKIVKKEFGCQNVLEAASHRTKMADSRSVK